MSELFVAANTAAPAPVAGKTNAPAAPAPVAGKTNAPAAPAPAAPVAEGKTVVAAPGKTEVPPPVAKKEAPAGGGWLQMLPFILIFVVMIFFMNRSQKKQMQKRQEMMDKITKGTKVLLTSGIYGTVDAVHEDSMIVEIATGVKIKVAKAGVAGLDTPDADGKLEGK